ncbi:MAG: hypothetical protein V4481_04140 [Patescibacteria group bacterium]
MKLKITLKIVLTVSTIVVVFVGIINRAAASTVSFEGASTIGLGSPVEVSVKLAAPSAINAVSIVLNIPEGIKVIDISDGNSIVNIWIERPHVVGGHQVVGSGIIPGGFSGTNGQLFALYIEADKVGSATLAVDPSSNAYLNKENGTADKLISKSFTFSGVEGKGNPSIDLQDTESPESFTPALSKIPSTDTVSSSTESGDAGVWAVVFSAQDKKSGIDHYEVAESGRNVDLSDTTKTDALDWKTAESPYILADQALKSYVYVKAVDKKGNYTIQVVSTEFSRWYEHPLGYILTVLLFLAVLYAISRKRNRTRRSR